MIEIINSIRKYNYWGGNSVDLGYRRMFYTEKIGQYIGNKLVKVLVGQRRAGKSYILRQLASQLIVQGVKSENILYINKEYMEYITLRSAMELEELYKAYRQELKPQGKVYLFIDEIQYIDQWERFVNSHSQDLAEPCELFISGSNSNLLSGELATLLSGRYVEFEVFPFSYTEYCGITEQEIGSQSYKRYLQSGALPELFNLPNDEMKQNYVSSIKDTVMLRDIVGRYKIKDVKLLDDLFVYLVNSAASIVSVTNIINFFASKKRKTNYETLSTYITYLENSFLVHRVERYNIKGKDTISGNCKFYLNDLSYRNYLYSGYGYGFGYLLENAVYLSLRRAGYQVYVGSIKDAEVDFVAIKGDKKLYLQVTLQLTEEQTVEREYRSLKLIDDNFDKYVVSMDDYKIPTNEGIEHISAWNLDNIILSQNERNN
ncbi:MAG: ATP-binding protein [Bacteroides graminisolvens]|jgi:predicted AAA+ superfamily ATPase|uniref:ATP-binding protein n=1 Tax=Bacteroides graminisolvens TaxID=477666 RepID=UPI0023F2422E|nr:ATP-binding protein [Bacteroides graminisolvens]MDD4419399.1 ATP-binding protein [Bacteroides graminisolvens]